ncbi:MAG: hypothetical protein KatS3mg082_1997 [Nitrospiraceae bacterium]|nr:MAG: hypothetical protein KatS3mg082_1997 [Nitrospiraceae bacterium]
MPSLHYDLPWNPNRLEQREGRVDRYGQKAEVVKAIRYFSPDSPVDGVVLDVLLNKAREIHRVLGTHVPVPEEGETVTEALLNALFLRAKPAKEAASAQLELDFGDEPEVEAFHRRWELDAEREKINRTRFAQRALKPADVRQELEETDAVLGDPDAVRQFVLNAGQRLGLGIEEERENVRRSERERTGEGLEQRGDGRRERGDGFEVDSEEPENAGRSRSHALTLSPSVPPVCLPTSHNAGRDGHTPGRHPVCPAALEDRAVAFYLYVPHAGRCGVSGAQSPVRRLRWRDS